MASIGVKKEGKKLYPGKKEENTETHVVDNQSKKRKKENRIFSFSFRCTQNGGDDTMTKAIEGWRD